jgi:hypothetical protein
MEQETEELDTWMKWMIEFKDLNLDSRDYSISAIEEMLENPVLARQSITEAKEFLSYLYSDMLFGGFLDRAEDKEEKEFFSRQEIHIAHLVRRYYKYGKEKRHG